MISRIQDKFEMKNRVLPPLSKEGWNITEDIDWGKFKKVVVDSVVLVSETVKKRTSAQSLSNVITEILTKGLQEGVGHRIVTDRIRRKEYPARIVRLMKENRRLGEVWKTEKVEFANSLLSVPPESLVVAAQDMREKNKELDDAIQQFKREVRAPIKKLCKMKSKRGMKMFWKYVSRIPQKRCDISMLQNKQTGVLHCEPEKIIQEVTDYIKVIFSGSDQEEGKEDEDQRLAGLDSHENVKHDHCYS